MAESKSAYGTIHLNVSIDADEVRQELKTEFNKIAARGGEDFRKTYAEHFEKGLNRDMSASVKEAVTQANKSAPAITPELDLKPAEAKLKKFSDRETKLRGELDLNLQKAERQVRDFERKEAELQAEVKLGTKGAEDRLRKLRDDNKEIVLKGQLRKDELERQLDQVSRDREVYLEATARNSAKSVAAELDRAARQREAEIKAEAKETARVESELARAARTRAAEIKAEERNAAQVEAALNRAARDRTARINVVMSGLDKLSNIGGVLGGIGAIGIPGAAAAAGGLAAVGVGAAGAATAAGVASLAFRGMGDALTELEKNTEDAAAQLLKQQTAANAVKSAQSGLASATSALAGAQAGLKSAQSSAAQATQSAARAVTDAQKGVSQAVASAAAANKAAEQDVREAQAGIKEAVADSRRANEDAARAVVDAQRRIADAVEDAARANEDAADRVKGAERDVVDAQKDAKYAQDDLNDARKDAAQRLREYKSELAGAALDERDAILSVKEAEQSLRETLADPEADALRKERARLNLDEAKQRLKDTQQQNKDLQKEADEANRKGVEGSDEVKRAKDRVKDSNQGVVDAEKALADAREDQNRTFKDGLKSIAEARRDLADAEREQRETAVAGEKAVAEARQRAAEAETKRRETAMAGEQAVADARQQLADARAEQDRVAEQNAASLASARRGVEDAERGVADAERGVAAAMAAAALASAEQTKAFDKLSPAAQEFALKLENIRQGMDDLAAIAAGAMFPKLTTALEMFEKNPKLGQGVKDLIEGVGGAVGDVAIEFAKVFSGAEGEKFIKFLNETMPSSIRSLGDVGISVARIGAGLLEAMGPAGMELLNGFADWLGKIADYVNGAKGQAALQKFFNDMVPVVESVGALIASILGIFGKLAANTELQQDFKALIDTLTDFTNWISDFMSENPGATATVLETLLVAFLGYKALSFLAGTAKNMGALFDVLGGNKATKAIANARELAAVTNGTEGSGSLLDPEGKDKNKGKGGRGKLGRLGAGAGSLLGGLALFGFGAQSNELEATSEQMDKVWTNFGRVLSEAKGNVDSFKDSAGLADKALSDMVAEGNTAQAKKYYDTLVNGANQGGIETDELNKLLPLYTEAVKTSGTATQKAGEKAQTAAEKLDNLRTNMDNAYTAAFNQTDAVANLEEAFDNLNPKIDTQTANQLASNTEMALGSEKGRELYEELKTLRQRTDEHAQALIDEGASLEDVNEEFNTGRTRLIKYLEQQGLTKEEAQRLTNKFIGNKNAINDIPTDHVTDFSTPGLNDATKDVGALDTAIGAIKGKKIDIEVRYDGPAGILAKDYGGYGQGLGVLKKKVKKASGGLILGPGTGTSDSIPAMLSNREFVVKADSVKKVGVDTLNQINQTGSIPHVAHFAKGGLVVDKDEVGIKAMKRNSLRIQRMQDGIQYLAGVVTRSAWKQAKDATALGGGLGPGAGGGVGGPGMGYKKMFAILKARFPDLILTSGLRPGARTAGSGNVSMHAIGRAVDVSPRMDVFNWIRDKYPNSKELIYSPAGMRQLHNGQNHMYTGITKAMHYNHVHWGYDKGGILQPGDTLVRNKTGKPEAVFNPAQFANLEKIANGRGGDTTVYVSTDNEAKVAQAVVRGLQEHELKMTVSGGY